MTGYDLRVSGSKLGKLGEINYLLCLLSRSGELLQKFCWYFNVWSANLCKQRTVLITIYVSGYSEEDKLTIVTDKSHVIEKINNLSHLSERMFEEEHKQRTPAPHSTAVRLPLNSVVSSAGERPVSAQPVCATLPKVTRHVATQAHLADNTGTKYHVSKRAMRIDPLSPKFHSTPAPAFSVK